MFSLNGIKYNIDALAFDKDGLLFQSQPFWQELARLRLKALTKTLGNHQDGWLKLMGVNWEMKDNTRVISSVDHYGIMGVASVEEEILTTAGYLCLISSIPWVKARDLAREAFEAADQEFDLKKSLKPRQGFPEIWHRLDRAGIPYGLATSDQHKRAISSVNLFHQVDKLAFVITSADVEHGKPSPDMLLKIAKIMDLPPARIGMIGDSLVDVKMARAAGCLGIGLPELPEIRLAMATEADVVLDSLDDLIMI